jgi:DtxR family Mn-dependent transcriptional regulator
MCSSPSHISSDLSRPWARRSSRRAWGTSSMTARTGPMLPPAGTMAAVADGFHPPLEEYLETIWELEEEGIPVIQARLAEHMNVSAPSVSEMIRRLKTEGWVDTEGRSITLTEKGSARAISVVRKHRLAERLLTDVIGLPWHKTHVEACRWEHVISDEVEERLVILLGNPPTCPHGNPIPGAGGPERNLSALAGFEPGDHIRLERVTEQVEVDLDALIYLDSHGFVPGVDAEVRAKAPDGTLTLDLEEGSIAIGAALASQLFVSVGASPRHELLGRPRGG